MQSKFRIRFGFSWYDNRKSKIENRKLVGLLTIAVTFAMSGAVAQAQPQAKVPKIGYLVARPAASRLRVRIIPARDPCTRLR